MPTIKIDITELSIFLSILLRLSIVVFLLPIFSRQQVPMTVKAAFTLALSAMLHPVLRQSVAPLPLEAAPLALVVLGEIAFGMVFALSVILIFSAFQLAGEIISFEMGFGFAQTADPQSGAQVTIFSMWFQLIATLLLFSLNGHHVLLRTIVESFSAIPLGSFAMDAVALEKMIAFSGYLFVIAIRMSAPVMIALLLTHVGMGLMSKFAPQINILTTSFPLTIAIGILFMSLSVLIWGHAMERFYNELYQFLGGLSGR